jgi:soluble lytic murein transglycosylase-like protein
VAWRNLSEMDLAFARSRRDAARRRLLPPPKPRGRRPLRMMFVTVVLLVVLGEVGGLAISSVKPVLRHVTRAPAVSCPLPVAFRPAFERAAASEGIPLSLLTAVSYTESRFDPSARSPAGASGLLQVMPAASADVSVDARKPDGNVLAGARYLRLMLDRFGSRDLALAAYNAGPTAVDRAGGPPTRETIEYVRTVNRLAARLDGCR